jgi:hypothetical protein
LIIFEPPSSPWWKDFLLAMPGTIAALAAVVGVCVARAGLSTWREQIIGKRRIKLAEKILAQFYEAGDILRAVRSPIASGNEALSRPGRDDEDADIRAIRDVYYPIVSRLTQKSKLFSSIHARRYRAIAVFGLSAIEPFDNLRSIYTEITVSARHLMIKGTHNAHNTALKARLEAVVFEGPEDEDPFIDKINAIVTAVEQRFRPEIQNARRT